MTEPLSYAATAALPSFGASYMALITETSAEQRRQAGEQRDLQTEVIAEKINQQAKEMRKKAVTQLVIGVTTGSLQVALSAATMVKQSAKLNSANKIGDIAERNAATTKINTDAQTVNQINQGVGSTLSSINQFAGTMFDANIKEMDADIECSRTMLDKLKSLDESLREVIQKTLGTIDNIQSGHGSLRIFVEPFHKRVALRLRSPRPWRQRVTAGGQALGELQVISEEIFIILS